MGRYENYRDFLVTNKYTLLSSSEDLTQNNQITFRCVHGHETSLKGTVFGNKKCKEPAEFLCTRCKKLDMDSKDFEAHKAEILEKSGHVLLTNDSSAKIATYICGNCGSQSKSNVNNLKKTKIRN